MNGFEEIIRIHAKKYPLMRECDLVKLAFQNEFGGGHLITDPEACERRIIEEYRNTVKDESVPFYEDIGNGMVRVNLASPEMKEESLAGLSDAFVISARLHSGSADAFGEKLEIIKNSVSSLSLGFGIAEMKKYLEEYALRGHPPVSHSEIYRQNYRPAYRVVLKELL